MDKVKGIAAGVVTALLVSVVLILLDAALMLKLKITDSSLKIIACVTYLIANFCGGFVSGKFGKKSKFIWGTLTGAMYFLIVFIVSLIVPDGDVSNPLSVMACFVICAAAGCVGGMISS